jgi:hypothetical protein
MQLLGSRVQNIQVPECSPEGRRNVGGKAAREQTLAWVSTDIYMLLYVFFFIFFIFLFFFSFFFYYHYSVFSRFRVVLIRTEGPAYQCR